ncbi:flagellar protein FlaG [Marinomonas atlantica]|uniref:flagellar protein FlaG n=1 Tax=Marinomonas atlantica TaxID=1806668 RepID=UPI0008338F45|nr:flagellar protein FlaG [Marinomonas atlantica]
MSISSDFSKLSLTQPQTGQTTQVAERESLDAFQKNAKVVEPTAESNNMNNASHQNNGELNDQQKGQVLSVDDNDVEDVNIKMRQLSVGISFEKTDDGENNIVKVIDQNTGDIVRQIPSEEFLEMSKRLDDIFGELNDLKGNLINSEV